eukprot:4108488-Lingulodinium_polyedra.AAC.1
MTQWHGERRTQQHEYMYSCKRTATSQTRQHVCTGTVARSLSRERDRTIAMVCSRVATPGRARGHASRVCSRTR